jgi:uncharacterized protein (TIGR02452 family)
MSAPPVSIKFKYDCDLVLPAVCAKSTISVHDMDAIDLSFLFPNSLILNLADNLCPGGGVDIGCGTQEESIFRRTNYHRTLLDSFYPIENGEAVYSANVALFKESEHNRWESMEYVKYINLVACPALKYPRLVLGEDGRCRLTPPDIRRLEEKISTVVQIAVHYRYDTIIFGAMDCGDWCSPGEHVAEIFREVLQRYEGCVQNYAFAILSTAGVSPSNADVFASAFSS